MAQGTHRYVPLKENTGAEESFPGLSARAGKHQALLLHVVLFSVVTLAAALDIALASQPGYQHPESADCC